ncbi:MAG: DUF2306 domain-containing protein [Bacteroidota bacterium]
MSKYIKIPLLLFYVWFTYLMLGITLQYLPINLDVAFLRIKQDVIHLLHYQTAFFTHVFSSIFVLIAGFTQFSKTIRTNYYAVHKWSGWLYVICTVLLAAPSGFLIGWYANGGWFSQLAFCLLAILWFVFTIIAVIKAVQKDIRGHQNWMLRSFALAMSAITLRAWKYVLVGLFHPRPMDVYRWVAWLSWVVNLVIIEIYIYKKDST